MSSSLELLLKIFCFTIHFFWELSSMHNVVTLLSALHADCRHREGCPLLSSGVAPLPSITDTGCRARKCLRIFLQGLRWWICLKRDSFAVHKQAGLEEMELSPYRLLCLRCEPRGSEPEWEVSSGDGEDRMGEGPEGTLMDGHGQGNWRSWCECRS